MGRRGICPACKCLSLFLIFFLTSTFLTHVQWPLDKRPPYYASQGDRFSDILHMLLKMRSLPPKATPRPENGILKAVDGSDANAARWFDMIKVSRKHSPPLNYHAANHNLTNNKQPSSSNNAKPPSSIQTIPAPSIFATEQNCYHLRTYTHDLRWSTNCD
jgi:hypothetical protein